MRALGGFIDNAPISLADRHFDNILFSLNNNKRSLPYKTRFSRFLKDDCDDTEVLVAKDEIICVRGKPSAKNGETHSATSLLNLYKRKGERLGQDLCGHFLIIILHRHTATLVAINDKYASYPFYYTTLDSLLIFCDRFRDLVQAKVSRLEPNLLSVQDYLQFGKLTQGRTWFHSIAALKPSQTLCYQEGEFHSFTVEEYGFLESEYKNFDEAQLNLKQFLSNHLKNQNYPLAFMSNIESSAATQYLFDFSKRVREQSQLQLFKPNLSQAKDFFDLIDYWLRVSDHAFCDLNAFMKPLIFEKGMDAGYVHFISSIGGMRLLSPNHRNMPGLKPKRFSWIYGLNQTHKEIKLSAPVVQHWLDKEALPALSLLEYENKIQDALLKDEKQFYTANALYESDVSTLLMLTESAHIKVQMPYLNEPIFQLAKKIPAHLLFDEPEQKSFFEKALCDLHDENVSLQQNKTALQDLLISQTSIQEFFQDMLQTALQREYLDLEKVRQLRIDFHTAPALHLESAWRLISLELYLGELETLNHLKNSAKYG